MEISEYRPNKHRVTLTNIVIALSTPKRWEKTLEPNTPQIMEDHNS